MHSVRIDDFGPGPPTARPGPLLPVLRVVSVDAAAGRGRTALGSGPKTGPWRRKAGCSPTGRARRGARWSVSASLHDRLQLQWSSNTCRAAILADPEGPLGLHTRLKSCILSRTTTTCVLDNTRPGDDQVCLQVLWEVVLRKVFCALALPSDNANECSNITGIENITKMIRREGLFLESSIAKGQC